MFSPTEFIYKSSLIESNVIYAAQVNDLRNLLLSGSPCIYPKFAEKQITEKALLTVF